MHDVAIIGMGAMGSRMAQRWLNAGHRVWVSTRDRSRARALEAAGATFAASPREAARHATVVVSMVTDDAASAAVWTDEATGARSGLRPGAIAVESSTLTPAWATRLAAHVQQRGATLVAAPVVGSRPQAETGALVVLAGGPTEAIERLRPELSPVASAVHAVGDVAQAMAMKLAVNTLFATQVVAWAEVLGVLARAGIDPAAAAELLGGLPVTSPALRHAAAAIVARRFDPRFPIALVHKDLDYFVRQASEAAAMVPSATATRDAYHRALEAGHGGDDIVGVASVVG